MYAGIEGSAGPKTTVVTAVLSTDILLPLLLSRSATASFPSVLVSSSHSPTYLASRLPSPPPSRSMKKKIKESETFLMSKSPPSPSATSGTRRLSLAIALVGSGLCLYALLVIFTSHPCSNSLHCRSLVCGSFAAPARQRSPRNGAVDLESQKMIDSSPRYTPLTLPSQGRAFAASSSLSTNLSHIIFGIAASSRFWNKRKEYARLWWRADQMRGFVWLDQPVNQTDWDNSLPPLRISENTTRFKYTNKLGHRSAIRISRIVSETFRLGLPDVHWFVMGDDDTIFIPENLVRVLSKYDHRQYYYIGSNSESHLQNLMFSYNMAYGGGGFAVSYPLAKALEKMQDRCLERYPSLFGSDDRIQACMAELGVPLTKEAGFHQYDIYGNLLGLLAAHPVTPVVSIHHLDVLEPIFPNRTRVKSLLHLMKSIRADPSGFLQQSVCYDTERKWSISVAWGFVVQIYRGIIPARDLELPSRTFYNWHRRADYTAYSFNTRAVSRNPCQKAVSFYMSNVNSSDSSGWIESNYHKPANRSSSDCKWTMASPETMDSVKVVKQRDDSMWSKGPRRKCCRLASSSESKDTLQIVVRDCDFGEIAAV